MKRNLIYHVSPFDDNDTWLKNIAQLRRRWNVFDGVKIVSAVVGPRMVPMRVVRRFLPDPSIIWMRFENSVELREAVSFLPMLRLLKVSADPDSATFYAHAKGVTRNPCDLQVRDWRNQMYANLLDRVPACMELLKTHPCVGAYRDLHPGGIPAPHIGECHWKTTWDYRGTFFWFSNREIFDHPRWDRTPMNGWGVEFWLSHLYPAHRAACVYRDESPTHPDPCPDPADWPVVFLES